MLRLSFQLLSQFRFNFLRFIHSFIHSFIYLLIKVYKIHKCNKTSKTEQDSKAHYRALIHCYHARSRVLAENWLLQKRQVRCLQLEFWKRRTRRSRTYRPTAREDAAQSSYQPSCHLLPQRSNVWTSHGPGCEVSSTVDTSEPINYHLLAYSIFSISVCLSVCLSVQCRYCRWMNGHSFYHAL